MLMSVQFECVPMRTHPLSEMMAFERMLIEKTSRPIDNGPNIEAAFEQWVSRLTQRYVNC